MPTEIKLHIRSLARSSLNQVRSCPRYNTQWLSRQIAGVNKVFGTDPMSIQFVPDDVEDVMETSDGALDVGVCNNDVPPTGDQLRVLSARDGIEDSTILVVIAGYILPVGVGCACHPEGKPGLVIAAGQPQDEEFILAHEIGHVLGLVHTDSRHTAMLMCPTTAWSVDPPQLTVADTSTVIASLRTLTEVA